jgi:hypothetical protein
VATQLLEYAVAPFVVTQISCHGLCTVQQQMMSSKRLIQKLIPSYYITADLCPISRSIGYLLRVTKTLARAVRLRGQPASPPLDDRAIPADARPLKES